MRIVERPGEHERVTTHTPRVDAERRREGLHGHTLYNRQRCADELLEKLEARVAGPPSS